MIQVTYNFTGQEEYIEYRQKIKQWINETLNGDVMLEIAINEAVQNAIEHGDSNKPIEVNMTYRNNKAIVRVKGSGYGFCTINELERARRVWDEEDKRKVSGRGIRMMLDACDRVTYNSTGTEVMLVRKRKPAN
ncbi:ATP-binding protein [Niallia taxi]|uniref:ATP-binding protein n=1 Tax=Niallia taxi TaxID=2499688 RepID=UPI0015F68EDE|nr:ATP-binding protein [Niallia taxi]